MCDIPGKFQHLVLHTHIYIVMHVSNMLRASRVLVLSIMPKGVSTGILNSV